MNARLPAIEGEWIDRKDPLSFRFEGDACSGYRGDVVTSALWASGIRALGRSFKYHRLRGVLSLANHDVNTMMQWGERLNLRADVTPLAAGMDLYATNTRGGLQNDRLATIDRFSAFLPVGFYYKAFHRPKKWFPFFENVIRRAAGLGTVDVRAPRVRTPKRNDWCDVLVIGAGAAGLAAARAAASYGSNVVVVDENARIGGSLTYRRRLDAAAGVLPELSQALSAAPGVRVFSGTTAAGCYADRYVALVDDEKLTRMRAGAIVVATGTYEQPAVFRNNDLPGVMLGTAAQRLVYRYAVRPAERAVVLCGNDRGYEVALDLLHNGVAIAAIVDLRAQPDDSAGRDACAAAGIRVLPGHCVYEAIADNHGGAVAAAMVGRLGPDGTADPGTLERIACDAVIMSVGFAPAGNLLYQAGTRFGWDERLSQFLPSILPPGVFAAGEVNGVYDLASRLQDGERAGAEAARFVGREVPQRSWSIASDRVMPNHPFPIVAHPKGKNFVDFDEDLHLEDFHNAALEGFDNIELLKRYTTVGMGPSQGKHSNMNAIRILARIRELPIEDIGTTTARPFVHPVPLSHLAGRGFQTERLTPLQGRHMALGARFMSAGIWRRPEYYGRPGATREQAIAAEVAAVHQSVAMIDVGTLGKLEVYGPDAVTLLERVYTGKFAGQRIGTTRYALMTDESGIVIDDGIVIRLADRHFYFTTTTSNSATIYRELSRLITLWGLAVGLVNLTGSMGAVNLAGPLSRDVLAAVSDVDVSDDAFPFLAARQGNVLGIPARLMRVGFVGALSYEVHVPAQQVGALWDGLMAAGRSHGIVPFGVEAQRVLRLEKGHVIVGQDTDGLTTPFDAGLDFAVKMDKPFFVGQRSLRIHAAAPQRQRLVAFVLDEDETGPIPRECHLVIEGGNIAGRITSIARSAALGRVIGLAFVLPHMTAIGYRLAIRSEGGVVVGAMVVNVPFATESSAAVAGAAR